MSHPVSYIEAIGQGFPGVEVIATGDGAAYEDLVHTGGSPMPTKAEVDAWILDDTKTLMWRHIQTERDRRKHAGVLVGTKWFHSDDTSRIQQLGLVMMGASLPAGIMWKTMDGSFIEMTPTLAAQIFQAIAAKDIAIFSVAETHRAQMIASASPGDYNYLTGTPAWPTVFGE